MTESSQPHDPSKPAGSGVTQREVPSAEGHAASTGAEASAAYGSDSIQILEGLEAVRKRPGMYIADGHENCRSAEEVARAALDALESLGASVCEAQNEIAKAEAALRHMGELVTTLQLLNQSMQDFSERLLRPSLGLLMSMAVRSDHGLGVPGFYDSLPGIWPGGSVTHAQRVEAAIVSMRQILEEAAGTGFYRPERDAAYIDMIPPEVRERQDQARREAAAKGGQNG